MKVRGNPVVTNEGRFVFRCWTVLHIVTSGVRKVFELDPKFENLTIVRRCNLNV